MSEDSTKTIDVIDIMQLMKLLPHRYPFLLVDKIVNVRGDEYGVGIKNVTYNEPQFTGHFPNQPIMPGVLIIEGMAQTAGAMCVAARQDSSSLKAVYFMTIDGVKFRKPVVPGDTLEYHMTKTRRRNNMWWFKGEAKVAGQKVAEAEVSAMLVDN